MILIMATVCISITMGKGIKVSFRRASKKESENTFISMELYIKENGRRIKDKAMEHKLIS